MFEVINDFLFSGDQDIRRVYSYTFQWTKNHRTAEELKPLKFSCDELADKALKRLQEISEQRSTYSNNTKGSPPKPDMVDLLLENSHKDPVLGKLWTEVNTVPDWVDWDQVGRGQDVLYRYALPLLTGFFFHAFFGINGTSRNAAETLSRTGGHSAIVLRQRFFETFQMMLQITQPIDTVKPGNTGHLVAIRVRLLHASVRQRILKLAAQRPSYYNVEKFGVPINHLDSIQSLFEFSFNHARLNMPREGVFMRKQEELDYLALWRWIAYVMGIPNDVLETPEKALATMESAYLASTNPTGTSRSLVENGIRAMEGAPPLYATRSFWEAGTRWFMGNAAADDLGLGRPGLYYWAVMAGLCWLYMIECYTSRSIPWLDKKKITYYRKVFWNYVVESKEGLGQQTTFAFKYIPELDKRTRTSDPAPDPSMWGAKRIGIEEIGFCAFLIACVSTIAVGFCGVQVGKYALGFLGTQVSSAKLTFTATDFSF